MLIDRFLFGLFTWTGDPSFVPGLQTVQSQLSFADSEYFKTANDGCAVMAAYPLANGGRGIRQNAIRVTGLPTADLSGASERCEA